MNLSDLLRRVDEILDKGNHVLSTRRGTRFENVDHTAFYEFRTSSLSFLLSVFGERHPYYSEFDHLCNSASPHDVNKGIGILKGVRAELAGGWLVTAKGLAAAEVFSDFIEMALYLLAENYKDPSAVLAGSVLEEHLRQLCIKNSIDITYTDRTGKLLPKKADTMNADLSKAGVYNTLDQKNVTAWLDLRNKAAHGRYAEYTKDQAEVMAKGIRDFVTRNTL